MGIQGYYKLTYRSWRTCHFTPDESNKACPRGYLPPSCPVPGKSPKPANSHFSPSIGSPRLLASEVSPMAAWTARRIGLGRGYLPSWLVHATGPPGGRNCKYRLANLGNVMARYRSRVWVGGFENQFLNSYVDRGVLQLAPWRFLLLGYYSQKSQEGIG